MVPMSHRSMVPMSYRSMVPMSHRSMVPMMPPYWVEPFSVGYRSAWKPCRHLVIHICSQAVCQNFGAVVCIHP